MKNNYFSKRNYFLIFYVFLLTLIIKLDNTSRTYCKHCSYVPVRGKDPESSVLDLHSKSKVHRERLKIS